MYIAFCTFLLCSYVHFPECTCGYIRVPWGVQYHGFGTFRLLANTGNLFFSLSFPSLLPLLGKRLGFIALVPGMPFVRFGVVFGTPAHSFGVDLFASALPLLPDVVDVVVA